MGIGDLWVRAAGSDTQDVSFLACNWDRISLSPTNHQRYGGGLTCTSVAWYVQAIPSPYVSTCPLSTLCVQLDTLRRCADSVCR